MKSALSCGLDSRSGGFRYPRDLRRRGGIVGMDQDVLAAVAHRPGQPDRGPGTTHAPGVDLDHPLSSNGFFGERIVSRTGTAPKPNSRRNPLIR